MIPAAVKLIHAEKELLLNYFFLKDPVSNEYKSSLFGEDQQNCQEFLFYAINNGSVCLKYGDKLCIARQMPVLVPEEVDVANSKCKYHLKLFGKKIEEFGMISSEETLILNLVSRGNLFLYLIFLSLLYIFREPL